LWLSPNAWPISWTVTDSTSTRPSPVIDHFCLAPFIAMSASVMKPPPLVIGAVTPSTHLP
jgi:hypothetical protein